MYMRMVMLSLCFPARDPYERAAQKTMHRFHRLLLPRILAPMFLVLLPVPLLPGIWFQVYLALLFFAVYYVVAALCVRAFFLRTFSPSISGFFRHRELSQEVVVLCHRIKIKKEVSVFVDPCEFGITAHVRVSCRMIILSPEAMLFTTRIERSGIFAHELGHLVLPFDRMANFFKDSSLMHAREFAVDAIGVCLLKDARPLLTIFAKLSTAADPYSPCKTHPPLEERVKRLLDIEFTARHAR